MKIKLVFDHWQRHSPDGFVNCHETEEGIELEKGDFHSGSTFDGEIVVAEDEAEELASAMGKGFHPLFYFIPDA